MKDKHALGKFIKTKRMEKNYSQKELADLLFVTDSAVSKWERGVAYPDITLITDICKVLDITEHELIEATNDTEYRKIKTEATKYANLKKTLFWIFNISYAVAILTCFIVNLAVNHTFSWFFIVLTSVMTAYTFCPTITWAFTKLKKVVFIGSTFTCLFLLFLTISIYTSNYWFMIPTIGVLLGYFIIFYPILFTSQKHYLQDEYNKLSKWFFISYILGILIILTILYLFINLYVPINLGLAYIITCGIGAPFIIIGLLLLLKGGKKIMWIFVIALVSVIFVIILISLINGFYINSTKEIKSYNITESYSSIKINSSIYDIRIEKSAKAENEIQFTKNKRMSIDYKVVNDELVIDEINERKFFDKLFNMNSLEVILYLNEDTYDKLTISSKTSDIEISNGINFNSVNIKNTTGDVDFNADVVNDLIIKNTTGDIKIKNSNVGGLIKSSLTTGDSDLINVRCNKLEISISTGDVELNNVLVTTNCDIVGSTGDVKFNDFDAENINIKVSTGDVKGTLLSHKFFIAKSSTGKVDVPTTRDGGECIITTSTGNIKVTYK